MTIFIFLGGIYTFSLPLEIFLGVIYLILAFLLALLRALKDYPKGEIFIAILILILLLSQFSYSISQFITTNNNDMALILGKFLLPILMTGAIIPFLYVFAVCCSYEQLFAVIRAASPAETNHRVSNLALISVCGINLTKINKFRATASKLRPRGNTYKEARKILKDLEPTIMNPLKF